MAADGGRVGVSNLANRHTLGGKRAGGHCGRLGREHYSPSWNSTPEKYGHWPVAKCEPGPASTCLYRLFLLDVRLQKFKVGSELFRARFDKFAVVFGIDSFPSAATTAI